MTELIHPLRKMETLAGVAQLAGCGPANRKVAGSFPVTAQAWAVGSVPGRSGSMFLSLSLSLPSLLFRINLKNFKR